jgi:outer membrane protein assembly factor BamB
MGRSVTLRLGCGVVRLFAIALAILGFDSAALAENWPGWRGLRGDGSSLEEKLPTAWDGLTGQNIAWKVPILGQGHASPIVWGDRLFYVTCLPETKERQLVCVERLTGKTLWTRTVITSLLETRHQLNSFASSTPATDGELVYVTFLETDGRTIVATNVSKPREVNVGQMVVAAYSFAGEQQWIARPGEFVSVHGYSSPPVIVGNLVVINGDHDGESYIVALDRTTGKTVWKSPREHQIRSYCVPLVRELDGKTQLILSGSKCVTALEAQTGKTIWTVDGPTEQFVASMVFDGERFFVVGGYPTHHVLAIRKGGMGNVTQSHVAWSVTNAKCYVPSPVLAGPYLFVADDRGTGNCFDPVTGERWWQERLGTHYSASPVAAGGFVYFLADDGATKIVRPGKALEVVAENPLGETTYASAAVSGGNLFVRGEQHLWCIGPQPKLAVASVP